MPFIRNRYFLVSLTTRVKSLIVCPLDSFETCPQLKYVRYSIEVGCLLRSVVQCLALSYASTEMTDAVVTDKLRLPRLSRPKISLQK